MLRSHRKCILEPSSVVAKIEKKLIQKLLTSTSSEYSGSSSLREQKLSKHSDRTHY